MFHTAPSVAGSAAASFHGLLLGDETVIDVTELREVDHWTELLGVTEAELRLAVAAVGDSARDVRDHLGK
jgi:hypothetical protein